MITAFIILISMSLGACIGVAVAGLCAIQKDPAASRIPLADVGGPRGRLDLSPIPGSSRALALPLAEFEPPAMGRGLNKDHYCADDVAITITDREIWLEVDKDNLLRVKRIKRLHVNDWRKADAKIS